MIESRPRTLVDYITDGGRCPTREWLDSLDTAITARIEARIKRVAFGNFGDVKPVGDGVSELRIDLGSGYRVYLAQFGDVVVVLLCGGSKKTQIKDIEKAKEYWQEFRRRNNEK